jgi:hypothetical protein
MQGTVHGSGKHRQKNRSLHDFYLACSARPMVMISASFVPS